MIEEVTEALMKLQLISILIILSGICLGEGKTENPPERYPATWEEAAFLQEMTAAGMNLPTQISIMINEDVSLDMMLIPAGTFEMGSPGNEKRRKSDEGPLHFVEITKPFYFGKYEVSQAQYFALMGMHRTKFSGSEMPMENVNWTHVNGFTGTLSNKFNLKFRLPTEAEWEYACRAGTKTPFYTGKTITTKQANFDCRESYGGSKLGRYLNMPTPVGKYPPNAFGLHDMHGNLWEWCSDFYQPNYYKKSPKKNPKGPVTGNFRVVKGGAWDEVPYQLRAAYKEKRRHRSDKKNLGFRILLEIPEDYDGKITQRICPVGKNYAHNAPEQQQSKKIQHELVYDEKSQQGYISIKGKGLEARSWMLKKIEQICSSKNIILEEGKKPEAGYYRLLDETLKDGVYTIKFEAIR